jgi:alkanesulfonate monooxygenase SsuD/methylene tetrahydromethanopterin reductase-like flavin-dependent oxidoreductase (luciferase family)
MRIGVSLPPFTSPSTLVEMAAAAERAGWDGVFVWDHLHFARSMRLDVHDPWVLLGAMAVSTRSVLLGTMVTPLARRRPQVVAKQVVTLDHLSGGRAVLGVGLGEPGDEEFAAFGDPGDAKVRAELLDELLTVIERLWSAGPVRFDGRHHHVDAELHPAPLQRPRPAVWVAGMWPNRAPLRRAARWDGYVPMGTEGFLPPTDVAAALAAVRELGAGDRFDVVATRAPGTDAATYEAAGATWLIESCWPVGEWVDQLDAVIAAGPPRRPTR